MALPICGTISYRFIGNDEGNGSVLDESDFELSSENPMYTFVVYFPNNKPAFSCQIREDENGQDFLLLFLRTVSGLKFQKGN